MTVREIRAFLSEQYGTDVSPDFISSVTDEVMEEIGAWQQRPLEPMYPVIFFDALRVKLREEGLVRNKAIYLALGVLPDGTRDILGIWIENTKRHLRQLYPDPITGSDDWGLMRSLDGRITGVYSRSEQLPRK